MSGEAEKLTYAIESLVEQVVIVALSDDAADRDFLGYVRAELIEALREAFEAHE